MEPNITEERRRKGQDAFGSKLNADRDIAEFDTAEQAEAVRGRVGGDRVAEGHNGEFTIIKEVDRFSYFYTKAGGWWSIRLQQKLNADGKAVEADVRTDLQEGERVEKEHADLVQWLREYSAQHEGQMPADEEIFKRIAEAHLKEDPEYYKKLASCVEGDNLNAGPEDAIIKRWVDRTSIYGREKAFEIVAEEQGKTVDEIKAIVKAWHDSKMNNVSTDQDRRAAGSAAYGKGGK